MTEEEFEEDDGLDALVEERAEERLEGACVWKESSEDAGEDDEEAMRRLPDTAHVSRGSSRRAARVYIHLTAEGVRGLHARLEKDMRERRVLGQISTPSEEAGAILRKTFEVERETEPHACQESVLDCSSLRKKQQRTLADWAAP